MKKNLILLSILLYVFLDFYHSISAMSQDLGRHIKMGEIILASHFVPKINLFSYTYPNFPFINTHWLSEVIFYAIVSLVGFPGLLFFTTLCACLAFFIILQTVKKCNPWLVGFLALLYIPMLSERTDIRPEIFSFLFISIFLWILYKYRTYTTCPALDAESIQIQNGSRVGARLAESKRARDDRKRDRHVVVSTPRDDLRGNDNKTQNALYKILNTHSFSSVQAKYFSIFLLPFLELLWVNIHIYFILGPILIGIFLVDQLLEFISAGRYNFFSSPAVHIIKFQVALANEKKIYTDLSAQTKKKFLTLSLVFLLTSFVTLLNPNGLAGALYPFNVFHNYGYTIQENQSIFFLENYFQTTTLTYTLLKIFTLCIGISLLLHIKKSRLSDWLLFLLCTFLAFSSVRNIPIFVFGTFTIATTYFSYTTQSLAKHLPTRIRSVGSPLVFSLLFLWSLSSLLPNKSFGAHLEARSLGAVDFFITHHLSGPLFNTFDNGSYLDYRLYPREHIFVDGRPEAYPASFFQNVYIPMQQDPAIFAKEDQIYHFQTILFEHTDQTPWAHAFLAQIVKNPKWGLVYLDNFSLVLVKTSEQNQDHIHDALIDATHGKATLVSTKELDLYQLANFYSLVGWREKELAVYQQILTMYPTSCSAIYQLGHYYFQTNNQPLESIYQQQYQSSCQ